MKKKIYQRIKKDVTVRRTWEKKREYPFEGGREVDGSGYQGPRDKNPLI